MEQDLEETAKKKKDALNTFENVTKTILTDEITGNSRAKLEQLKESHQEVESRLHYKENLYHRYLRVLLRQGVFESRKVGRAETYSG